MNDFEGTVEGRFDTLKLVRNVILKAEVGNYKQDNIVQKQFAETYYAHNAIEYVLSLKKLFDFKFKYLCKNADIINLSCYNCKEFLDPLFTKEVLPQPLNRSWYKFLLDYLNLGLFT